MKTRIVIFAVIVIGIQVSSSAQKKVLLNIPESGKSMSEFVPTGYDTLQTTSGDLNKDGLRDLVLVLAQQKEDSVDLEGESKRVLLILLKQKEGYMLGGKSTEVVMCRACGGIYGDPFVEVTIKKGVLQVYHYGGSAWRWSENRKFRFQENGFYLIGSTSDYYWNIKACNGNEFGEAGRKYRDMNWSTGDEEVIERNEDCKLIKHTKTRLKRTALVKLENFKYED